MSTRGVEEILERQVRSWELRRKLAAEGGQAARDALVHLEEGPWVSISRQWGSGGRQVADEVGRRLGWQLYDREILTEIARHDPVRESLLSRVEQRAIGPLDEYLSHLIAGGPGQPTYLKEMMQVVWGLAKKGQAVIVGRGVNWFLNPEFGLRVRIVSALERRIERFASREGIDPAVARAKLHEFDEQRRAFVRQVFQRDIDDPLGYDLVLNLDGLDVVTGAAVVCDAVRGKLQGSSLDS